MRLDRFVRTPLAALLLLVFALSLACNPAPSNMAPGAPAGSSKTSESAPGGEVTVRLIAPSGNTIKSWQPQIDRFNELNKGKIRVEAEAEAKDPLLDKLVTQFLSGQAAFDVVSIDGQWGPRLAPYLEPLNSYIEKDKVDVNSLYGKKRMDLLTFEGQTKAIPIGFGGFVLFYRKDLFDEAGVKVPTTLDEYLEAARKLTKRGPDGKVEVYGTGGLRAKGGYDATATLTYFLLPSGGRLISEDGKGASPTLKEPVTLEVLKTLKTIVDEGLSPNPLSWDQNNDRPFFAQGKSAMAIIYSSIAEMVEDPKESNVAGKVGYALLKLEKKGSAPAAGYANGWSMAIDKNSKNKAAAWEFIKYMGSVEAQKAMIQTGNPPTPISVLEDPDYVKQVPSAQALKEMMVDYGFVIPTAVTQGTEVEKVVHEEMQLLFSGQKSPEQVQQALFERIDQVMKR